MALLPDEERVAQLAQGGGFTGFDKAGGIGLQPEGIAGAGVGQIQQGDGGEEVFEVVVDFGHLFRELAQDNFDFGAFLPQKLAQLVAQVNDGVGFDI